MRIYVRSTSLLAWAFSLLFCIVLAGCKTAGRKIVYEGAPVFGRCDTASPVVLATGLELNYPKQMFVLDTIIGVVDVNAAHGYYVHLFNERGGLLTRIGKQGRGPGEVTAFGGCFVNRQRHTVSIFSFTKVVEYDMALLSAGAVVYYRDLKIPETGTLAPNQVFNLDEDRFFLSGQAEKMRFAIQQGNDPAVYRDYPQVADNPVHNRAIFGHYTVLGFDENLDRFVQATYIGGILDIFRIDGRNIIPHRTAFFYEPVFVPVQPVPSQISWGDETTIGFQALDCTDRYIYTLLNGEQGAAFKAPGAALDPPYTKSISVFNWDGKPIKSITLNQKLVSIAAKNDSTAYLVSFTDGDYVLIRTPL